MEISNLTKEQIRHFASYPCPSAYGFEGTETYPNCGECLICLCKKELGLLEGKYHLKN